MSIICRQVEKGLLGGRLLFFTIFSLLISSQALAEKWYFEPVVSMRLGYNDNTQLSTDSEIATSASTITGNAVFGVRTEVSDVSLSAKMVDERFNNYSYLNTNDKFLKLESSYLTELNQFGLDLGYDRVSTRTSEFEYSGYSTSDGTRITKSISPYWDRDLTERTSLRVDAAYSEATYETTGSSGLNDNTNKSVNLTLRHQLTEKSSLQAVTGKSLYESANSEFETTKIQLGFDHQLSETFSVNMLLGPSYTISKTASSGWDETSSVGRLINIGFSKKFEFTTLSGVLNSSESAGGEGKLIKNTRLSLSLQRQISDRTSFSVSGSVSQNESGGGLSDDADSRSYVSFDPKLSWKATPWWTITGSYSYKKSENTSSDEGPAKSNAVYLTLEYIWPKESF